MLEIPGLTDQFEPKHVRSLEPGRFSLTPLPSSSPPPSRSIPEVVALTISKWHRIGDIYFKYSALLNQGFQEDQEGAWLMTDKEKKTFNRNVQLVSLAKRNIIHAGFYKELEGGGLVPDLSDEKNFSHPLFFRYLKAQEKHDEFVAELNADIENRRIRDAEFYRTDLTYRFMIDLFIEMTAEYVQGRVIKYDQEEFQHEPYWQDQVDLITEVFYQTIIEFADNLEKDKKKFEAIFVEAERLVEFAAENLDDGSQTTTSMGETTSSSSSPATTQSELQDLNMN